MDMMGRVGLIEIPMLIAPDQKAWMDRMIKEGKIAIPPGGTLEKGSLYSMFINTRYFIKPLQVYSITSNRSVFP